MLREGWNLGCGQSTEHQGSIAVVGTPTSSSGFLYGHLGVELGEPGLCSKCFYLQSHPLTAHPSVLNRSSTLHFAGHPTLVQLLLLKP